MTRGWKHTEKTKAKIAATARQRWAQPGYKEKMAPVFEQLRKGATRAWKDPKTRARLIRTFRKGSKRYWSNPATRRRQSAQMKRLWAESEDYRRRVSKGLSDAAKRRWQKPDFRRRMKPFFKRRSEQLKKRWKDPVYRVEMTRKLHNERWRKNVIRATAEDNRKKMHPRERKVWAIVQPLGFEAQAVILDRAIADFIHPKAKIAIEIGQLRAHVYTALRKAGYEVLAYENSEVDYEFERVAAEMQRKVKRALSSRSSPSGRK